MNILQDLWFLKEHSPTVSLKCVSVAIVSTRYSLVDVSSHAAIVLEDICSQVFNSSLCRRTTNGDRHERI